MFMLHISDLHYGFQGEEGKARLGKVFRSIKQQNCKPEIALITGDLNHAEADDYKPVFKMLKALEIPFLCITGNHDNSKILMDNLAKYVPEHPHSEHKDKLDYVYEQAGIRFIGLDSFKGKESGGEVEYYQLQWLEEKLADNSAKIPVVIMVHQPTFNAGLDFFDIKHKQPWAEKFNKIVAKYKDSIKLIASGHVHNAITSTISGIPAATTFSANWEANYDFKPVTEMINQQRQAGYSIYWLNKEQLVAYAVTA